MNSRWEAVCCLALVKNVKPHLQVAEEQHAAPGSTCTCAAPLKHRVGAEWQSIDSHAGCLPAAGRDLTLRPALTPAHSHKTLFF